MTFRSATANAANWLRWMPLAGAVLLSAMFHFAVLPYYPGSPIVLAGFSIATGALASCLVRGRLSFVLTVFGTFMLLGFAAKLLFHLMLGMRLAEPVGSFDGSASEWDTALGFATAGLAGCVAAMLVASVLRRDEGRAALSLDAGALNRIRLLLALLAIMACIAYGANWAFDIIRLGYPPRLVLPNGLHPLASFAIAWGLLLAGLALVWWPVAAGVWHPSWLVHLATALGLAATLTMGSRAQLLLYLAAAGIALLSLPGRRPFKTLMDARTLLAGALALSMVGLSLFAVNWQRENDFSASKAQATAEARWSEGSSSSIGADAADGRVEVAAPALSEVQAADRTRRVLATIAALTVKRWLGLEGTMVMAGSSDALGMDLLRAAFAESPTAGMDAIYQKMAGDPYAGVEHFTFLTIPGLVGFAAMSGDLLIIFTISFALLLVAHFLERVAGLLTRNHGVTAALGVALAYLLMQLNYPWSLFVLAVQFVAAVLVMGLVRIWVGPTLITPQGDAAQER